MMCGGTTPAKEADQDIRDICEKIRSQLEGKCGQNFSELTPTHYKTQVVAGTNYFVKAHTGSEQYVHIRIFQSLPHAGGELDVHSYQLGKAKDDELEYF